MPRRICSTVRKPPQTLMLASPSPVEPAAPMSLSVYWPAPTIAESPTRPGTFQAIPLVVVTAEMSPPGATTAQLIVAVGARGLATPAGDAAERGRGVRALHHQVERLLARAQAVAAGDDDRLRGPARSGAQGTRRAHRVRDVEERAGGDSTRGGGEEFPPRHHIAHSMLPGKRNRLVLPAGRGAVNLPTVQRASTFRA